MPCDVDVVVGAVVFTEVDIAFALEGDAADVSGAPLAFAVEATVRSFNEKPFSCLQSCVAAVLELRKGVPLLDGAEGVVLGWTEEGLVVKTDAGLEAERG